MQSSYHLLCLSSLPPVTRTASPGNTACRGWQRSLRPRRRRCFPSPVPSPIYLFSYTLHCWSETTSRRICKSATVTGLLPFNGITQHRRASLFWWVRYSTAINTSLCPEDKPLIDLSAIIITTIDPFLLHNTTKSEAFFFFLNLSWPV